MKTLNGGGKVWAGQADDPFFLDLGGIEGMLHISELGYARVEMRKGADRA